MSSIAELERQLAEQRAIARAPTEQELAERRAVDLEHALGEAQRARTAAETWLEANRLAVAKLNGQLATLLEDVRKNPNERDVQAANKVWSLICERARWAVLVARRFPGAKPPELPALVAPGFRGMQVTGLSVEAPGRLLHPVIVAWWSAETRGRAWETAAAEWIAANGARLPEDLRAVLVAAGPVPTFEPPPEPRSPYVAEVEANMRRAVSVGRRRARTAS